MQRARVLGTAVAIAMGCWAARAAVQPASPFTDDMVLQQGIPLPVWGTASPGESVTVQLGAQKATAKADAQGQWRVTLQPLKAERDAAPESMTLAGVDATGAVSTVVLTNVLAGEVWICSGQSNMQWPLSMANNAQTEMGEANYPRLRMYTVPNKTAATPQTACGGRWVVSSPATAGGFSAVGYFFARYLHKELGVPVGMLNTSWGGSPIEPWTAIEDLRKTQAARARVEVYEKALASYQADRQRYDQERADAERKQAEAMAQWNASLFDNDVGAREKWSTGVAGSGDWKETAMPMPDNARFLKDYIGFVWCRRQVEIPDSWKGRDLNVDLGPVDEVDTTYVNGSKVGEALDTAKRQTPRRYKVPAAVVTNTDLVIVVRVMNQMGGIGMLGRPENYMLSPAVPESGDEPLSLAGTWTYAIGGAIDLKARPRAQGMPAVPGAGWDVSTIYNAMVAPLAPYGLRGAIWYQGESNANQPDPYAELLPALMSSWRRVWGQGDFPFLYVQLANFMARQQRPVEPESWAGLRDSQFRSLSATNSGMAVIIDIGAANDIHPRNKQDVGKRLALWALARTYGRSELVCSGPLYKAMSVEGNRARISFEHVGGGLMTRGDPLVGFAVAGEDRVFHAAQAVIEKDSVVVSSDKVAAPVAVRYAWANNPICNLFNREDLPASPFRTDAWPAADVKAGDEPLTEPAAKPN